MRGSVHDGRYLFDRGAWSAADVRGWWNRPVYLLLLVLLLGVPLLGPAVPPLVDLPAHMGRYRVMLDLDASPWIGRYYGFHWHLIGNLGVDLLVVPLARLIGLEPAVKLIVLAIPPLTGLGFLAVAREVHGRVPPTAAFALPLTMGYPFQFGFVNFALSMALAFLAFALWLRLGRIGRLRLRAAIFVVLGLVIWVAHVFGWAVLCLLCGGAEVVRHRRLGDGILRALIQGAIACLPLAPPIALMLLWREDGPAARTLTFFAWNDKLGWLQSILRTRWVRLDGALAAMLAGLLALGVLGRFRWERVLLAGAGALALVYLCLPRVLIGSDYADMRLAPYLVAVAVLALGPRADAPRWMLHAMASAALLFALTWGTAATVALRGYAQAFEDQVAAVPHIPAGARVLVLTALQCPRGWGGPRLDHVGAMALVRRDAFVNDQFADPGAQLLSVRLPLSKEYARSPSQQVRLPGCHRPEPLLADKLAAMPDRIFTHVWLIGVPAADRPHDPRLLPVWASADGALYQLRRASGPSLP